MSTYAYISCPIPVSYVLLTKVADKLHNLGYSPLWWLRGMEYKDNKLRDSQIFVLMSVGNKFDYPLDHMTAGCRKELLLAKSLGKSLYLAYWKNNKDLNIYPINMNLLDCSDRVIGMSRTYLQPASQVINSYQIF
jgi:hypothetical protein